MTESEKLEMLKSMSGETDEGLLLIYLTLAGQKILERAFPFHPEVTEVPAKYNLTQIEVACYLINKRGAEGQTGHSENGIARQYENASVPKSMLRDVIPAASAI